MLGAKQVWNLQPSISLSSLPQNTQSATSECPRSTKAPSDLAVLDGRLSLLSSQAATYHLPFHFVYRLAHLSSILFTPPTTGTTPVFFIIFVQLDSHVLVSHSLHSASLWKAAQCLSPTQCPVPLDATAGPAMSLASQPLFDLSQQQLTLQTTWLPVQACSACSRPRLIQATLELCLSTTVVCRPCLERLIRGEGIIQGFRDLACHLIIAMLRL